jgi:flagellar basal body P-ring formation protein FlgA
MGPTAAWARPFATGALVLLPGLVQGQSSDGISAVDLHALKAEVQQLLGKPQGGSATPGITRVDVQLGQLDPRLRLVPCRKIQPHLPPGAKLWGSTRVGLRCVDGPVRWNVYLPVTVHVFGPALVATRALPQGTVLSPTDLRTAEVDLAAEPGPALTQTGPAVGRIINQVLQPGEVVRQRHLQQRKWFAAGDPVRIVAQGAGFSATQEGVALSPGMEGQVVRVRTDSGRVIIASPVSERTVAVAIGG